METWEAGREHLLNLLAEGAPLDQVLTGLCTIVEARVPNSFCSVLLLDPDGQHLRHAAAPSLPDAFCRAVDGLTISPKVGSCGTAAFLGQEVVVESIATHPLWVDGRALALAHGLAACASTPIFGPEKRVLGTFAFYHTQSGPYSETELRLLRSFMGLAAIAIRVTRKEMELQGVEHRFSALVKHSRDFISLNDSEGCFRYISPSGAAFFGLPQENLIGRVAFEFVHPDDLPKVLAYHNALQNEGNVVFPIVFRALAADGAWRSLEVFASTYMDESLGLATVLNGRDITEQRLLEENLKQSESRLSAIVQAIPDLYFRARLDGTILDFHSNRMPTAFGDWDPRGHRFQEAPIPDEIKEGIEELARCALQDGKVHVMEYQVEVHGRVFHREARISPSEANELVVFIRDITERLQSAERMERARRHESRAMIIVSVAHNFNNLLAAIQGNAELIRAGHKDLQHNVDSILAAVHRAADLNKLMIESIGLGQTAPVKVNVNQQIEMLKHGLPGAFPNLPHMIFTLAPGLPQIEIDPQQLNQILHALMSNACEAMTHKDGSITLKTGQDILDLDEALSLFPDQEVCPGAYVTLEVQDTGCGMGPPVLARIFEPFFTTKFTGRGLGLSSVQGCLKKCGAGIRVTSQLGEGSSFTIYFPAVHSEAIQSFSQEPPRKLETFSGKILVVDDEEIVRTTTSELLRMQGFETLEAKDGQEAVDIFQRQGHEIAVVLMDLSMPRMNGHESFRAIRAIDPKARVILSSGYSEQDATQLTYGTHYSAFLQKPYGLSTLRTVLAKVMSPHY